MFDELRPDHNGTEGFAPVVDRTQHIDYGSAHPAYWNKNPSKVAWTLEEIDYMFTWKQENVRDSSEPRQLRRCLNAIAADSLAHPIFHWHHVSNPQRLRFGYEKAV